MACLWSLPKTTIPEKWLQPTNKEVVRQRFELPPLRLSDNLIHETKDFIELRGSPRPARAGGNLVGRGIANPMSERTRGFELPRKNWNEIPTPRAFLLCDFLESRLLSLDILACTYESQIMI
jgi:hypothetical protein